MIDDILTKIFGFVLAGGPSAIISILIAIIMAMAYVIYTLVGSATDREKRIDVIIDNYYKGNMDLTTAFNELKQVLYQIKDRVSR
jgi:dUTPase